VEDTLGFYFNLTGLGNTLSEPKVPRLFLAAVPNLGTQRMGAYCLVYFMECEFSIHNRHSIL
jgi:hypothetical protein